MESTHLAFDLGASSCRAILGTLDCGHMYMEDVHRFSTPIRKIGNRFTWDVEAIWAELYTAYESARHRATGLASLSVDSWGTDYVPLDRNGSIVREPYCYRDSRTNGMMKRVSMEIPERELYNLTGIQRLQLNTIYQAFADRIQEPELTARVDIRLMMADYFNYRFCGRAVAERTLASTSQLMDMGSGSWAVELMHRLHLSPKTWPTIVPAGTLIGRTTDGIAVVAGCSHDTACAVAAVPAARDSPPWAYLSSGSWSLLGVERAEPLLTDAAFEGNFTNEAGIDGTVRVIKNITGLWLLQECRRAWQSEGLDVHYEVLLQEAQEARSIGTIVNFDNQCFVQPRHNMPTHIRNYCIAQGLAVPQTRGELVRLIVESLSQAYRRTLLTLEKILGERLSVLHIVGGGALNEMLCRMTADACSCTVVAGPAEATALGNLLIQARTLGNLPDNLSIRNVVRESSTIITYGSRGRSMC